MARAANAMTLLTGNDCYKRWARMLTAIAATAAVVATSRLRRAAALLVPLPLLLAAAAASHRQLPLLDINKVMLVP